MNIILTHNHTDFDAVASQLGAWKLYPEWTPIVGRRLNSNVRHFLTLYWGALPFCYASDLPPDTVIEQAILVDTQRLPQLKVKIKGLDSAAISKSEVRVIDHHPLRDDLPAHWQLEVEKMGSCATLFVEQIIKQQLSLSWVEATLLLLGIHEDTGSLVYQSTTARDAWAVAWLLQQGAHLDTLRQFLEHPLTEQQRGLYRQLLEQSEFFDCAGFQVVLAHAIIDQYVKEISSLVANLLDLYDPAALIVAVEMKGGVQLIARSTTSDIDVGKLMRHFGGGGHVRAAAAFVSDQPVAQVVEQLKEKLHEEVQPAEKVADYMSYGHIRSFTCQTRIKEAATLMQRWGHEGFPVIDEKQHVVGLLTRRDVDRALQHKLGNAPVTEFMHKGDITVTPQDSLISLQRIMTQLNIGQVPVIAPHSKKMIGIITRTDLLRRMSLPHLNTRANKLMNKVEAILSNETFALVRYIAQEADKLGGYHPYLVGGPVRDLLLNKTMKDLDIVIEGDAIKLARQLTETIGGRIVAHQRFGTAKWIVPPDFKDAPHLAPLIGSHDQPLAQTLTDPHFMTGVSNEKAHKNLEIDLITARTEFYEQPTALPQVEHASIKQDLLRRDFTINTLALSLKPNNEGVLLDFFGGEADLKQGLIRVLHNLSFVEDPTRIIRAVRFEQRFAFQLDARTEELLRSSLDLLPKLSPDRIRHELWLILEEKQPEHALRRLHELGILPFVLPMLQWDERITDQLECLKAAGKSEPDELLCALMWYPMPFVHTKSRLDRIAKTLGLPRSLHERLLTLYDLRHQQTTIMKADLSHSELYGLLHKKDRDALELLAILTEQDALRQRLRLFLDDLRHRKKMISGQDLRHSGLPPGPSYKAILDLIHQAVLDGTAPDEASQRKLMMAEVDKRKQ